MVACSNAGHGHGDELAHASRTRGAANFDLEDELARIDRDHERQMWELQHEARRMKRQEERHAQADGHPVLGPLPLSM